MTDFLKNSIHVLSEILEIPAIIILILAILISVFELGSVIVEFIVIRKKRLPDIAKVVEDIHAKKKPEILKIIAKVNFQSSQKIALEKIVNSNLKGEELKLLATEILSYEEAKQEKTLYITDIIARIAPMFGLMATLIPLGPGLIALGQGDTSTLADSLLTAFDATVAGLAAAGLSYIISKVRRRWYNIDMNTLDSVAEEIVICLGEV